MYDDPTPLSTDENLAKKWANDEGTWKDIYARKPLEYLEAISRGESPRWDDAQGKYVYLNTSNSETSFGGNKKVETTTGKQESVSESNDYVDNDLPF